MKGNLLAGKRGLIMGVVNDKSLAWGIAQSLSDQGAELAFTYQGEPLIKRITPLAESVGSNIILECDVTKEETTRAVFADLKERWGSIDFIVHAIAFSDKNELRGRYVDTTRANFLNTMDISCYSLTSVAREALPLMKKGGSILTLTYYGAQKVLPNYNIMGVAKAALEANVRYLAADLGEENIRVNAISAGPVKTLAASGIGDFRYILKWNEMNAPLGRNTTLEDVGGGAVYLLSDLGKGTTGEVLYVDSGYHTVGMCSKHVAMTAVDAVIEKQEQDTAKMDAQ